MKAVWKFQVMDEHGFQADRIPMPHGATVRHVGMQDGRLCLWAEVDPLAPHSDRAFLVVGTGHPVPSDVSYVGSTQDRQFVWHVYEALS